MTKDVTKATFEHLVENLPGKSADEKANLLSQFDDAKTVKDRRGLYEKVRRSTTSGKSIQRK
jgi:hypothetical protein